MVRLRHIEVLVGLLIVLGALAFVFLAFKVSGLTQLSPRQSYYVTADFENIGDLKMRAPVTLAGVKVGEVARVELDRKRLTAHVTFRINADQNEIPAASQAKILTQGILGSNYIGLVPGFDIESENSRAYLHQGSHIRDTQSALILENLIGQLIFNIQKK